MKILVQYRKSPSPLNLSFLEVLREPLAISPHQYAMLEGVIVDSSRQLPLLLDRVHELENRLDRLRQDYLANLSEIKMARQALKSASSEYIYANSKTWWRFRGALSSEQLFTLDRYTQAS